MGMEQILGQALALVIAVCWAQNSLVFSYTGGRIGANTTAHVRLWIALPLILAVHRIWLGSWLPQGYGLETWLPLGLSGVLGFFIADILIFQSYVLLGPRETLVILTTSPIIIALLSAAFLQEALSRMQVFGILTTVAGVMWVVHTETERRRKEQRHSLKGILAALGGSVTQAAAMVLSRAGMDEGIHPLSATVIRISFGFIGLVVMVILQGRFIDDFRKAGSVRILLLITAAVAAGPIIGISLTLYAITLAPVGVVTAISQISPILLLPVERYAFGKRIGLSTLAGTAVAISGTIILIAA